MNRRVLSLVVLVVLVVAAVPVFAGHAWSTYHWRRTTVQITPPIHNNVSATWDPYLDRAVADWNTSVVIESPYGSAYGPISSAKRCTSATGKIEVCNTTYGQNGWLGIAGISLSGGHIVKGYTKLNDTYFNTAKYNTPEWRRMVACQEIGHDYGLAHVDETFGNANQGTCMDYTNAPAGGILNGFNYGSSNEYPNAHDYTMLETIYAHLDAAVSLPFDAITSDATRPRTIEELISKADQWGSPIAFDGAGRPNVFRMQIGANHDDESLVHVFWAPEDPFDGTDEPRGPEQHERQ